MEKPSNVRNPYAEGFFLSEFPESPDNLQEGGEILLVWFHLQVDGDSEEAIAFSWHVVRLHGSAATKVMPVLVVVASIYPQDWCHACH